MRLVGHCRWSLNDYDTDKGYLLNIGRDVCVQLAQYLSILDTGAFFSLTQLPQVFRCLVFLSHLLQSSVANSRHVTLCKAVCSIVMEETPEPVRFAAYNWLYVLKALCDDSSVRLPVLETIAFDPSSSAIDFWVFSDSAGTLKRHDRKVLLKNELLTACLRAILSPGELDLYRSEVEKCSASDWMVRKN